MGNLQASPGSKRFWCVENFSLADVLDPEEREELHLYMQYVNYKAGETIYFPGDPSDTVYTLHRGRVRLAYLDEDGRRLTFAIMGTGQVFGETALVGEDRRRWIAEAMEDCTLCMVPKKDLLRFAEGNPRLALSITKLVGNRMVDVENKLEDLLFKGVRERLARTLLRLGEEFGTVEEKGSKTSVAVTHQELAHLIAATRETTSTILGELEREGLLSKARGKIVLNDPVGLRDLS